MRDRVLTERTIFNIIPYPGRIAQLVKAPALHAGDHRFESCFAHFKQIKIIVTLVLTLLSGLLFADRISIGIESGIPLGDWSSELKTANSLQVGYEKQLLTNLDMTALIELLSYRTVADLYHVNIVHVPLGISYSYFRSGEWSLDFAPSVGLSVIERKYDEASEIGANEFYSLLLGTSYRMGEKIKITGYAKYLQERFINGKSYIGIGIAFGFSI